MFYSISSDLYDEVKQRLIEAIGDRPYFSGGLSLVWEEVECRLVVSCFVHRQTVEMPEGRGTTVCDLVPVWWEFHTWEGLDERLNDFSFETLCERLR